MASIPFFFSNIPTSLLQVVIARGPSYVIIRDINFIICSDLFNASGAQMAARRNQGKKYQMKVDEENRSKTLELVLDTKLV